MNLHRRGAGLAALGAAALLLAGCERTESDQRGPRGTGQLQVHKPSAVAALAELNSIPAAEDPADPDAPPASEVFVNVKVLNDHSLRLDRLCRAGGGLE